MRISLAHQRRYRAYYAARVTPSRPSRWLQRVEALAEELGAETILDYGCGAARGLSPFSRFEVRDYDPGVAEMGEPKPADLVVCIHTLEHVEPECMSAVLVHLASLTLKALFVVISCEASSKVLPDGTPWHTFVRPAEWWRQKFIGFEEQPPLNDKPGAEIALLRRR